MWLVRELAIDLRRKSNDLFVAGGRRSQRIESNISSSDESVTDPCCGGVIGNSGMKSLPSSAYFARDASSSTIRCSVRLRR